MWSSEVCSKEFEAQQKHLLAVKMEESVCLKCFIHRFRNTSDLSKTRKIYHLLKYRLLALHQVDGDLRFLKVGCKSTLTGVTLKNVKGFLWTEEGKFGSQIPTEKEAKCAVLYKDGTLVFGSIKCDKFTEYASQKVSDISDILKTGVSDFTDAELKGSTGEYIMLQSSNRLICLKRKEEVFHFTSVFSLPDAKERRQDFQIVNDKMILLDISTIKLIIYSITDGKLFLELDLERINVEPERILHWKLSPDLRKLSLIENTLTLSTIDLQTYVEENSGCLKISTDPTACEPFMESLSFHTSHIGDHIWRQKVLKMHENRNTRTEVPWYQKNVQANSRLSEQDNKGHKKWKVSGFKRKVSVDRSRTFVYSKAYLPAFVQKQVMEELVVGEFVTSVGFTGEQGSTLCVCSHKSSVVTAERLEPQSKILLSSDPAFPHMVVTDTHLACIVLDKTIQQEDFVSKMMVYAGASVADTLCHINKWGRCSIPLHTLESGLRQRQLDTVMFFLKSKENFFSATKTTSVSSPTIVSSPSWALISSHHDNLSQLEPALQLFIQTIRENMQSDQAAIFFSQKLSVILLNFLNEALKDGMGLSENIRELGGHEGQLEDLDTALRKVLDLINDVRQCVRKMEEKKKLGKIATSLKQQKMTTEVSSTQSLEELIGKGVLQNEIPALQCQLCERGFKDEAKIVSIHRSSLNRVVHYLSCQNDEAASIILSHLGYNVNKKLWEIALLSSRDGTRDYIIKVLRESLSPEQSEIVQYHKTLTSLYPCSSFSAASSTSSVRERTKCDILEQLVDRKYDLNTECGEISEKQSSVEPNSNEPSGCYSDILLDWIQWWDSDTKQSILMDAQICKIEPADLEYRTDMIVDYLMRHNRAEDILKWLNNTETVDSTLLHEIYQQLNKTTSYNQMKINLHCARRGLYPDTSNFRSLLHQVQLSGTLLQVPHPLHKCAPEVLNKFHCDFALYCVEHELPDMLWKYCFLHNVSMDTLLWVMNSANNCKWLKTMIPLYSLTGNSQNTVCLFEASLASAALTWSLEEPLMSAMLAKPLSLFATLMYSPDKIYQIGSEKETLKVFQSLDLKEVENALQPFPKLHSAIFPATTIDKAHNDVTVYNLLKDNSPFDPSRLFGWQTMNKLACEDAPSQLPHFAQQELSNKFGYSERLRFTYYLKQGRPGFAFISFIAEELDRDPTTISSKKLSSACSTALWIGIRNFHNPQISCACVILTEMLGQDSLLLRTYLQVGQEILVHLNNGITGNVEKRKEQIKMNEEDIVSRLCACVMHNKQQALQVLRQLEDAICDSLKQNQIPSTSFEAGQRWTVAILFCRSLQLSLTTRFLEICAAADRWLPFLWFAQIHQYSKDQLQNILYRFRSPHLQQHLHYVLENAESKVKVKGQSSSEGQTTAKGKDVRSSLYTKIGLTGAKDKDSNEASSSDEENINQPMTLTDDNDEAMRVDVESAPDDLFRIVFVAQSSRSPWNSFLLHAVVLRNPLLAELAACCQDASVLCCLCGWLVSMMNVEEHKKFLELHGKTVTRWNMKHLMAIIDTYLHRKWHATLATGFDIFQPESPMVVFLKFSAELMDRRNYSLCKTLLDDYKEALHTYCHEITEEEKKSILGDSDWMQQLTYRILYHYFTHSDSLYDILQLLKLLDSQSMVLVFKFDVPEFGRLARLLQMVVDIPLQDVNFSALVSMDKGQFESECVKVVKMMIDRKMFRKGRDFAKEAGLSQDQITMAETLNDKERLFNSPLWHSAVIRHKFWKQVANSFFKHKLSVDMATRFFQDEAEKADSYTEKTYIYSLCLQHMEANPPSDFNTDNHDKIYHTMSIYRIRAKVEQMHQREEKEDFMADIFLNDKKPEAEDRKKELLNFGKMPQKGKTSSELTQQEVLAFDQLIEELLDSGQIIESGRLITEFSHYSQDFAIILTCIRLAVESVNIGETMDMTMVNLMAAGGSHRRLSLAVNPVMGGILNKSSSMASLASVVSSAWDFLPPDREKTVVTMETLLENCRHGVQCCRQVINCYSIASILEMRYEDVVLSKEFVILKELLKTDLFQRFKLASEFLASSTLTNAEVAGFLCDAIVEVYSFKFSKIKDSPPVDEEDKDLLFDPSDDSGLAGQFVTLCNDPSLMGDRLLDVVSSFNREGEDLSSVLPMQTELLILAHLCHTTACNMEGISNILRTARVITGRLAKTHNFSLMVRLLTGVGRFNEMTYIFDSLKQNDQFELLLKKGIEKENSLKIALLDYLKRYHPGDLETYDMVAHNYLMHREIGQMLEARAVKELAKLKDKQLDHSAEIQSSLQNIVQYFSDAAESYFKENCIRHAQSCIRQARLVALQLHISSSASVVRVIHLSAEETTHFIASHSKFLEALIVSETYGKKGCWADALSNNVIQNGDFKYLMEFKAHIKLTPTLISDTVQTYQANPNKTTHSVSNLRKFLEGHCKDIKLRYKLALDFGFKDLVLALERGDSKSYIQDIVATLS